MRRSRVVVVYAGDINVGDYLSAQAIIDHMGGVDVSIPFEAHMPFLRRVLGHLGPRDLVIVGGGGLLKSTFDRFWREFDTFRNAQGFRYVLWGVGYCDVIGQQTRGDIDLLRGIVESASFAGLRDPMSCAPFKDLGHVRLVPCPSIGLVRKRAAASPTERRNVLLRVDHPELLRELLGPADSTEHERLSQMVEDAADRLGLVVDRTENLVPFKGRRIPGRVANRLAPTRASLRTTGHDANGLLDKYGQASLVVTSRLHGAILGVASGKPVIALSGDTKISEFFSLLGREEWVAGDVDELEQLLNVSEKFEAPGSALDDIVIRNMKFESEVRSLLVGSQARAAQVQ